ncbi:hypothetical protein C8R47DRAFT_437541 [Mycena vitilis]|nr:hypothetical protein C8R47DRAFT_437541 [Mycena vitilis]
MPPRIVSASFPSLLSPTTIWPSPLSLSGSRLRPRPRRPPAWPQDHRHPPHCLKTSKSPSLEPLRARISRSLRPTDHMSLTHGGLTCVRRRFRPQDPWFFRLQDLALDDTARPRLDDRKTSRPRQDDGLTVREASAHEGSSALPCKVGGRLN